MRFALVALAATVVVVFAVESVYRETAVDDFRALRTQQNEELARSLSNTLVPDVLRLSEIAASSSWAEMQASPEVAAFAEKFERIVENLSVYEVHIFAVDGLMLYSTDRRRIGAKMLMNEGLELAASGEAVSAIVRRDSFNKFDRTLENRDMIETYLPLLDDSGAVIGVFEIHSDISDFFSRLDVNQRQILFGVSGALLLLYLVIVGMFWRSDRNLFSGRPSARAFLFGEKEPDSIDKAKSDFVATISHEIRTPLNAVLGMTDLLNLTSLTRKQREYIQTIQSSGDMLISLVDNLLDFSQLRSGKLTLQLSEFDVMDLLERVLKIMGHSASSKGIELVGDIRHDLGLRIAADKRRLQQILVNVVGNAIKFTDEGEVVLISRVEKGEGDRLQLVFSVEDTGSGIDEATRERLFAAFASGARPASSQPYGSGLGLTISKQLLDAMDGDIGIGPREAGGTLVQVSVPVVEVPSPSAGDLEGRGEGWPARVLNLQANESALQSTCRLLSHWNIDCDTVMDVEEGIHRLRVAASGNYPFDCAIIDSTLSPGNRLQLVRRIRKIPDIAQLPVILLTSISEPLGVGEVTKLGHINCVNKPVLPLDLRFALLRSVQESPDAAAVDRPGKRAHRDAGDVRILIAEDNPVSSGVLQSMLQTEGYGADAVDNGPAVLEYLESRPYDLLLLDCQMPGMDGDAVTRIIRENPGRYSADPVIVAITADTTEQHRAECLAAGMDDFMPKPLRLDSLRSGLARWVGMVAERSADDEQAALTRLRENLEQKTGDAGQTFLSDYIDLFLNDTEERLEIMSKAFVSGDAKTVRREGHALKGSCLELGADRMARFCEDLSMAAKNDNLDEVGVVIGKLDREFARLRPVYESAQVSSTSPS